MNATLCCACVSGQTQHTPSHVESLSLRLSASSFPTTKKKHHIPCCVVCLCLPSCPSPAPFPGSAPPPVSASSLSLKLVHRYSRQHSTPPPSALPQNTSAGVSGALQCSLIIPQNSTLRGSPACTRTWSSSMRTNRPASRTSSTGEREARVPPRN